MCPGDDAEEAVLNLEQVDISSNNKRGEDGGENFTENTEDITVLNTTLIHSGQNL